MLFALSHTCCSNAAYAGQVIVLHVLSLHDGRWEICEMMAGESVGGTHMVVMCEVNNVIGLLRWSRTMGSQDRWAQ